MILEDALMFTFTRLSDDMMAQDKLYIYHDLSFEDKLSKITSGTVIS